MQEGSVPKRLQNALRRLHTNLGHPSNGSLVTHLAQAGVTGQAVLGAKHTVCERTKTLHQPRPPLVLGVEQVLSSYRVCWELAKLVLEEDRSQVSLLVFAKKVLVLVMQEW